MKFFPTQQSMWSVFMAFALLANSRVAFASVPITVWERPAPRDASGSLSFHYRPILGPKGDTVYIGGDRLFALNTTDGDILWSSGREFDKGTMEWLSPHVDAASALVLSAYVNSGTGRTNVVALAAESGIEEWRYEGTPAGTSVNCAPVALGNLAIYAHGGPGAAVVALNLTTGNFVWKVDFNNTMALTCVISTSATTFVVGTEDAVLWGVSIEGGGSTLWQYPIEIVSDPTVVEGILYVGSKDQRLHAISVSSGQRLWLSPLLPYGYVRGLTAGDSDGRVFATSNSGAMEGGAALYALQSANGTVLWAYRPPNASVTLSSPRFIQSRKIVLMGSSDGFLKGLSRESGEVIWSLGLPSSARVTTAVDQIRAVVFQQTAAMMFALQL